MRYFLLSLFLLTGLAQTSYARHYTPACNENSHVGRQTLDQETHSKILNCCKIAFNKYAFIDGDSCPVIQS